ncbi:serine/threonine-protein phosphatase [Vibrio vulnificus]|uniref:PP2C family protein-serine/threonine phosphatase n=1 Tax=Vibrio TaxID=662 RepID=UPI00069D87B0|nr:MULTISPECIES: protein phosphatase 2C domain-containing protein [Vibrio]EGQ9293680.1 serine/threonine-protein phosphatase [Vibrio vulnificus]PAO30024.1 serine/threonine-protein phosphatase [Vibrio vulnificus]PAO42400.1 serine/threonine-protein phosphatase [Vibrio vulnificus]PAO47189.1 serine/threonine-protein phosphatase [Vibrio vulnificus]PAO50849.1 serine/threonine-protein phosphatase [Vibrio vulnificus]
MDQDTITLQLHNWLQRPSPRRSTHILDDLPISIASDIGTRREENQDRAVLLRAQVSKAKAFVVGVLCDGMGGMSDGSKCASLAISVFLSSCIRNRSMNIEDRIKKAVLEADKAVYAQYQGNGGSTLSAFIFDSDGNSISINVGDSRIYCQLKNGKFEQLSVDDTIAGQLKQQEVASSFNNNLIQYIGMGSDIEPHIIKLPNTSNIQKLLLTSDGVHYIPSQTLSSLVSQNISPIELSKRLIDVSNWCGGHDNATALVTIEPSTLFHFGKNTPTGTIHLCDYNSDVFLIGIEKAQPTEVPDINAKHNLQNLSPSEVEGEHLNKEVVPEKANSEPQPDGLENKSEKKKAPRKRANSKAKKTDDDNADASDDEQKPQLRMDFDD